MSIRLNGSTSGYTELDAGAVAGNNTLKMPVSNGAANQLLRNGATPGTLEFGGAIVSGTAVASTSGTSIDFTGIPSWVKRVTVMFNGVSTNGASNYRFQLGISGGIVSTGYAGATTNIQNANATNSTVYAGGGFDLYNAIGATSVQHGTIRIVNVTGNTWVADGVFGQTTSANGANFTGGSVTLSGTLDRIRITTVNGTDVFDAGTINILYE